MLVRREDVGRGEPRDRLHERVHKDHALRRRGQGPSPMLCQVRYIVLFVINSKITYFEYEEYC